MWGSASNLSVLKHDVAPKFLICSERDESLVYFQYFRVDALYEVLTSFLDTPDFTSRYFLAESVVKYLRCFIIKEQ